MQIMVFGMRTHSYGVSTARDSAKIIEKNDFIMLLATH
jgi:hypothetical protein